MEPKQVRWTVWSLCFTLMMGCSSSDDPNPTDPEDPNDPGNPGNSVKITGTSPDYPWWGDYLTIEGSGFSEVKSENKIRFLNKVSIPVEGGDAFFKSEDGSLEIISASHTKLVIRVPYGEKIAPVDGYPRHYGPTADLIEVEVGGKKDTTALVKMLSLPYMGNFYYHYSWHNKLKNHDATTTMAGDSVVFKAGFDSNGSYGWHKEAGVYDKLRLNINGEQREIKFLTDVGNGSGWQTYVPRELAGGCEINEVGVPATGYDWTIYVEGTDKSYTRTLYVSNIPRSVIDHVAPPASTSRSDSHLNPHFEVGGTNLYYSEALFIDADDPSIVQTMGLGSYHNPFQVSIPFSVLQDFHKYRVVISNGCPPDNETAFSGYTLGYIEIKP